MTTLHDGTLEAAAKAAKEAIGKFASGEKDFVARGLQGVGIEVAAAIRALASKPATPSSKDKDAMGAWQLVPKEPTLEQGEAGIAAMCADEDAHPAEKVRDTYKAMLAATPASGEFVGTSSPEDGDSSNSTQAPCREQGEG